MTFEPIHVSTPLSGSFFVAILWALPVVLLAIRLQVSEPSLRRHLLVAMLILSAGALVPTLAAFHVIRPSTELFMIGVVGYLGSVLVAGLAFLLLRAAHGRKPQP
jgi:hypothetical protein